MVGSPWPADQPEPTIVTMPDWNNFPLSSTIRACDSLPMKLAEAAAGLAAGLVIDTCYHQPIRELGQCPPNIGGRSIGGSGPKPTAGWTNLSTDASNPQAKSGS